MIKFDTKNRINEIAENMFCVSIGTQANCAGIACVLASIKLVDGCTDHDIGVDSMGYCSDQSEFYGDDIPEHLKDAVLTGVSEGLAEMHTEKYIAFRLIGLFYHPVDSNINMHKIAGKTFASKWREIHA